MAIWDEMLGPADMGLMPFSEIAKHLRADDDHEATARNLKNFIVQAVQMKFAISGRDVAGNLDRRDIPFTAFEGAPIVDWVTCTDDEILDVVSTSGMRFISVNGVDGDNIKVSSTTFRGDDQVLWADIAMSRDHAEALLSDMLKGSQNASERWGLSRVLTWIATRDEYCASHCADMSVDACDTWLSIKRTHFGLPAGASASDAWSGELVPALDAGKLRASATRAVVNRLGVEQVTTGTEFPPEGQRFAASGHSFAETDNAGRSVLRPNGSNFAHAWTEYRELAFSRSDVIALWPEWELEDTEIVERGTSLPYALSPIQMYRWIVTDDEQQAIVAQSDAASIDETDFKKVMLEVGERCRTGKLLATGIIKGEPPAAIDATAWHRYGFHLYGDGIVTVRDISGPAATLLADYRMGRVQRISEEGKRTPVWFDVRIVASDFFREFPPISERLPPASEAKQAVSLPQQIAEWLSATYPQRPTLKNKELMAEVRSKAGHFGQFGDRTFETALSIAYPTDKKR